MSDIVVYKNELNTVPLRNFNSKEMDLFFSICSQMRDKQLTDVTFDFEELKELSAYKMTALDHFVEDLKSVYSKMLQLTYGYEDDNTIIMFVLFTEFEINKTNQTVRIRVNERFEHILNSLASSFTKFELEEFTSLRSGYSKTAYRLLKQYRATGYYIVQIDEFKRLFDVPESYQMSDIDKRILDPIQNELGGYFGNLKINKLRGKGKRKRFIDKIEFIFDRDDGIKKGYKVFRDKETGEFREKHIMEFDNDDVKKTFPEVYPISEQIENNK